MKNIEALNVVSNLCKFIFDNEQAFCTEFNIFVSAPDDFRNVSFSGTTCHISIYNTFNEPRVIYIDVQDILTWITTVRGENNNG